MDLQNFDSPLENREGKMLTNFENGEIQFPFPLGSVFTGVSVELRDNNPVSFRESFEANESKDIIERVREFRSEYPQTFNGLLLGNPEFSVGDNGALKVTSDVIHYHVYFAAHQAHREGKLPEIDKKYAALSVVNIVFDDKEGCFYMSRRPRNSQEDAGKIDAPGGVINPDAPYKTDIIKTAQDRLQKKLGYKDLPSKCIGVERIFDDHYSLYNVVMMERVSGTPPYVDSDNFATVNIDGIEETLQSSDLTSPAKASILLALAQNDLEPFGWDANRVGKLIGYDK